MTMKKLDGYGKEDSTVPMNEMKHGQIGYHIRDKLYILCIQIKYAPKKRIFLVLDDHKNCNMYTTCDDCELPIRLLREDEVVIIEYSE